MGQASETMYLHFIMTVVVGCLTIVHWHQAALS